MKSSILVNSVILSVLLRLAVTAFGAADEAGSKPVYLNSSQPVERRVEDLLARMTLKEKIDYLGGTDGFYVRSIPRLKLPRFCMSDGPMGCRLFGYSTAYPGGIALAATWDTNIARQIGVAMGRDCRARGVHILLGPAVNICRSPLDGRDFEYMGEDPCLASRMVVPMIQGIQSQGVLATVKHFVCNNQEWDRFHISSEVDERTLHEIYMPAFKAAVQQGHVGCVMTAYNLLNGVHCAQDGYLIDQVLKKNWDFKGFVMSDWTSTHDTVAAANAGLDLEMPSGKFMNYANLLFAIKNGQVQESTIDDKVRRILRTFIAAGFLDRPQYRKNIPKNDPENRETALEGAREAVVLLKNDEHILPLDHRAIKTIAVLGPNADPAVYCGGGSAFVTNSNPISVLQGIKLVAGSAVNVLHSTNMETAVQFAREADIAVVCVGFNPELEGEGHDRPFELPAAQIELIRAVAAVNLHTIVVINSGGGVAWAHWLDTVPAVLEAWYSGEESGRAVAEILFGQVNPSGKLPVTFGKTLADYPSSPYYHVDTNGETPYAEGIFVGYRGFDKQHIDPQFCFGYGLSYTKFRYGKIQVSPGRVSPGGQVIVTVPVENVGHFEGVDVVQLYIHQRDCPVAQPPKKLAGFARVSLMPGETKTISLPLSSSELAYYDVKKHGFVVEAGRVDIMVGDSSRDIRDVCQVEIVKSANAEHQKSHSSTVTTPPR